MRRRVAVGAIVPKAWRNGLGVTRDLLAAPGGSDDWLVSLADLEREAPFSRFPGADRTFTLVAGGPVRFSFEDGAEMDCPPLVPVLFPGDRALDCRLIAGPARALNVIARREGIAAHVCVLRLADGHRAILPPGVVVLYCVVGALASGETSLSADEALTDPYGLDDVATLEGRDGGATVAAIVIRAGSQAGSGTGFASSAN